MSIDMAGLGLKHADRHFVVNAGKSVCRMEYHEKLNVMLAGTEDGQIYVLDTNLGDILYKAKIADTGEAWDFSVGSDRVAVATKDRIGFRSDYNGILLLSSILQVPVANSTENVEMELSRTEAELLYQSLGGENAKVQSNTETAEFCKYLHSVILKEKESESKDDSSTFSVKKEKWNTVTLNYQYSSLKSAMQAFMSDLLKKGQYSPQLSIAASILERLNALLPPDPENPIRVDKTQMFSETARLNTFLNWPHRNYKWAHPIKMAQAGFYHSPSATGEDRAMCFTCNVCLVSWEPTDEPWSEHERHSPFCPFVRGEHTHNVPLALSYATGPGFKYTKKLPEDLIVGTSSCPNAFPMCCASGAIVIWDTLKQAKEAVQFEVNLLDLRTSDPLEVPAYSDIHIKPDKAWVDDVDPDKAISVSHAGAELYRGFDLTTVLKLSFVALISADDCPPSVVVAGRTYIGDNEPLNCWILIYGLSAGTLSAEEDIFGPEIFVDTNVTKQDPNPFDGEDELFGPYTLSESDMVSDSITVFSDTNMSESDSTYMGILVDGGTNSGASTIKAVTQSTDPPKEKSIEDPTSQLSLVQYISLPNELQHCEITYMAPTQDKTKLVVIFGKGNKKEGVAGGIVVYNVAVDDSNIVKLDKTPIAKKLIESEENVPISCCFVSCDSEKISLCCVLKVGSVEIYSLCDLSTRSYINNFPLDCKITSAAYCSSIDRIWCGTETGFVHSFYTGNGESDDDDNHNESEDILCSDLGGLSPASLNADLILNQPMNTASLQQLLQLTKFENVKLQFAVNAPSCWQKVAQAQKERKHPQHLHQEAELSISSVSYRLQRNKDSKREHLFEITFPKTANVGHFDIKFSFQMGCTILPNIEVTLYLARNAHNKRNAGASTSSNVDSSIEFGTHFPNSSSDFLKVANAEIICGPLDLSNHVDYLLTQGGTLVMTSPLLLLSKGRNFFLHLKAKSLGKDKPTPSEDATSPTKKKGSKYREHKPKLLSKKIPSYGKNYKAIKDMQTGGAYSLGMKNPRAGCIFEEVEKRKDFEGCDWIHEVSITVRQIKESPLPNSELERKAMLTSPEFIRRLLQVVTFGGNEVSYAAQSIALDLLTWIAAIKLCGPQLGKNNNYQLEFIEAVDNNLHGLILKCILLSDRSTAHKCAKLLILCIDSAAGYHGFQGLKFLNSLLKCLTKNLPFSLQCTSAGALQWFFLLLNRVRVADATLASESMLEMLNNLSHELKRRNESLYAILRTRFGLYGTPFEPDLFDIELPQILKDSPKTLSTLAATHDQMGMPLGSNQQSQSLSGMKELDFRDLLLSNPVRKEKLGMVLYPKQQIHGLLEVEPLHFTCHASSDGARIEKLDSGGSSFLPVPQSWEPFTNMPTGEGSKKSEPEKSLNKLKPMDSYYDYMNDIKFLEGNLNLIDMITYQTGQGTSIYPSVPDDINAFDDNYPVVVHQHHHYPPFGTPMMTGTHISHIPVHDAPILNISNSTTSVKPPTPASKSSTSSPKKEDENLRLLVSPWQQMMYVPPQQVLVIDRMHSGARRYVVLDFSGPILLTDLIIPVCGELASLSIDIWLHREESDGQRLVVASDIGTKSLVITDLQPPPICRYLKITTIGRYGMGTAKCRIPLGMFYGHSAVLPNDLKIGGSESTPEVPILSPFNIQAHLSVLSYVLEDLGCRYQLACGKLKRLLEPLAKPEIASIDHIAYYLPKGKERSKLGLHSQSDHIILTSYQDCITLQQQLNVTKNVISRLQRSLEPYAEVKELENPMGLLQKISSDKVHLLTSFLVESLLGISYMAQDKHFDHTPYTLYSKMNQTVCSNHFQNICVMENGQCQLFACTFLLRVCGFQPWWGNFVSNTLKTLFSSSNSSVFPQDRVFTLLVYLGQKIMFNDQQCVVLESTMKLLEEILSNAEDKTGGFTRSKIDMSLLGWTVMYFCLCLDGVGYSFLASNLNKDGKKSKDSHKNVTSIYSRWSFIQGESVLHQSLTDTSKASASAGIKRRMSKKAKSKLDELSDMYVSLGFTPEQFHAKYMSPNSTLGQNVKTDPFYKKVATFKGFGENSSSTSVKNPNLKDLLLSRRNENSKRSSSKNGAEISDIGINLNLNPSLCYSLTKSLGSFLLKMDSTCHSDIYLLLCKSLARIATSCRPAIRLGDIFTEDQIVSLVQTAVGNDFVRQVNWSSSWISHAIMCLILDILEGERLFPEGEKSVDPTPMIIETEPAASSSESSNNLNLPSNSSSIDPTLVDFVDAENDLSGIPSSGNTTEESLSFLVESVLADSDEYEENDMYYANPSVILPETELGKKVLMGKSPRQLLTFKEFTSCSASLSVAMDSRLETGIESSIEVRLRMMDAIQAELLADALTSHIDVPLEVLRNVKSRTTSLTRPEEPIKISGVNSMNLLSASFNKLFLMMSSENCCINIEKLLLFWLSINLDIMDTDDITNTVPIVPLSPDAVKGLITALTRNVGIGVQDWGLGFKCLSLAINYGEDPMFLAITTDPFFPEMILKFISGTGINLQRSSVPAMGPTVCEDFQNFLTRIFQNAETASVKNSLVDILIRVLSEFLGGPFFGSEFPLDAFNKFLDILISAGGIQSTEFHCNPAILISIVDHFVHALHVYVFFPNKVAVRSNAELKGAPPATTASGIPLTPGLCEALRKPQSMETVLVRLLALVADLMTRPFKTFDKREEFSNVLGKTTLPKNLNEYEDIVNQLHKSSNLENIRNAADIVVGMDSTMMRLFSVLANPSGQTSSNEEEMSVALNLSKDTTPSSVADFVIRLVSRLMGALSEPKQIVRPLFKFLSKTPYEDFCCPLIVSQIFVQTVLKIIKEEENLKEFVNFNCIEFICSKLVASSKQFFSSCPTFVSIMMQYIGRAESTTLFGQRKYGSDISDLPGGLVNVAPLGTITAVNYSANPSEVLLQATTPHRRARAPVWSYHFYPEETFLELIITLPCAVLLKEVQIVPHISSLATSAPSSVMVEIAKDRGNILVGMSPPAHSGGMTTINIILDKPEVAQAVLLRLYKPKDSNTLGLSQIRVIGCTAFCESAFEALCQHSAVVKHVESSGQWMYILDHAITAANPELRKRIIATAVQIPDILQSSYSMLMCPTTIRDSQDSYLPHVASVLYHFGSLEDVNEKLMAALLLPVQLAFSHGMIANTDVQSLVLGSSQLNAVVELIYKLCCDNSEGGLKNLRTVIQWLETCADEAVNSEGIENRHIVPEYVQGVAAALWSVTASRMVNISDLATHELLGKLFAWSKCLNLKSELKAAVDHMICSMCYCNPWLFVYLNYKMGILELIDEKKVENFTIESQLPIWYEEKSIWDYLRRCKIENTEVLCSPLLMTLARASQSEPAAAFIFESGLLPMINATILQFWKYYHGILIHGTTNEDTVCVTTPQLVAILEFYSELCSINRFKDWFGSEGSVFWHPILHLLSIVPSNLKASCFGANLYDLEYMVIHYLTRCCWSHPGNQKLIATRLCEIIVAQKQSPHKAVFLHSLSSFCRRLLIQVLLENEKMVLQVKNYSKALFRSPPTSLPLKDRHPSMGVNGKDRVFLISSHSSALDLIKCLELSLGKSEKVVIHKEPVERAETVEIPGDTYLIGPHISQKMDEESFQHLLGHTIKLHQKFPSKKFRPSKPETVQIVVTEPLLPNYIFEAEEFPDVKIPFGLNLSRVKAAIRDQNPDYFLELLVIVAKDESVAKGPAPISGETPMEVEEEGDKEGQTLEKVPDVFKIRPLPTTIDVFCHVGGFSLLSKHLPVVYPDTLRQMAVGSKGISSTTNVEKDGGIAVDNDWVKIENPDDYYEQEMMDGFVQPIIGVAASASNRSLTVKQLGIVPGVPPHSMAAFGLFLGLPTFSEVLLGERLGAQCMLRLAMGVSDDADGNDIFCSPIAKTLPTLPFQVLRRLLDLLPVNSAEGKSVRQAMFDVKAIHFILACLAIFTHHDLDPSLVPTVQHELVLAATKVQGEYLGKSDKSDDKSHVYWAKGTGFGTGSTQETWSVERAIEKRIAEEENITCLLQVLSSFISPRLTPRLPPTVSNPTLTDLPQKFEDILQSSCLFTTVSLYLKNDSVLDMARHIPLYTALLQFLRALVSIPEFIPLLDLKKSTGPEKEDQRISALLHKMKNIVDSYSKRLTTNSKKGSKANKTESMADELQDEGLANLITDIQTTATLVESAVTEYTLTHGTFSNSAEEDCSMLTQNERTLDEVYIQEMKKLQFAFFEMIVEDEETNGIRFTVSHFYENNIRSNWTRSAPARLKRLAQESITISTSLPIAFGSTIFVRCDTDRLDVMKVLITGPAGTPYSNGCFEFDIYFPTDYPQGPMLIHLQTTGRQRVRFNPNLYADGKVCLSILNTWHGRPEEKWNPQTSSLLPVLVAIQSLILNAEPYFNEPGYEKSRGTEGGERSCREYNAGIQIATLEWAMLDQIRHPSVCFKEIIHKHFWMKRVEILAQCDQWYEDLVQTCRNDKRAGKAVTGNLDPVTVFKNNLSLLRKEFSNMVPPPALEFLAESLPNPLESQTASAASSSNSVSEISQEVVAVEELLTDSKTLDVELPSSNIASSGETHAVFLYDQETGNEVVFFEPSNDDTSTKPN